MVGTRDLVALFAAALVLVVAEPLGAESPPGQLSAEAKRHYKAGQAHYQRQEYARAAEELRKAYLLTPKPLLLYNITLAEWRAGHLSEAISTGIRARNAALPEPLYGKIDARLVAFRTIQSARNLAARSKVPIEKTSAEPPPTDSSASESRAGLLPVLGWSSVALGAAGLGAAGLYARSTYQAVEQRNRALENGDRSKARRIVGEKIEPRQRAGRILLYGGAGLAVTGSTLLIVRALQGDRSPAQARESSRRFDLRPLVGAAALGLRLEGRF